MNYVDAMSELLAWFDAEVGFIGGQAGPDGPVVEPDRRGGQLFWVRLLEPPATVFVHPDCIDGEEISASSLAAFVAHGLSFADSLRTRPGSLRKTGMPSPGEAPSDRAIGSSKRSA